MRVYVTRELYPFTAGGIGRVISNILTTSSPELLARTAIVYLSAELEEEQFKAVYPEVKFVRASLNDYCTRSGTATYPSQHQFNTSYLQWESTLAFQRLLALEELHGPLEYVEFADWGAGAFASCQEKLLGRALQNTQIAVRLHTTDSVLGAIESRTVDLAALALYDLERKALADCDLIVAQLATVSEAMRRFYDFSEQEWNDRVVVSSPPVLLNTRPVSEVTFVPTMDTPIVFSSKIQHVKRPDVVVQGCVEFMESTPEYRGQVKFLAHAFDQSYLERLKATIPDDLADRFVFMGGMDGRLREDTIATSVCVFPSAWESFCLATYEASLSGAVCVLNASNPAFSDGTPWKDGTNCVKFDGRPAGLASALAAIFGAPPKLVPVAFEASSGIPRLDATIAHANCPLTAGRCEVVVACQDSGLPLVSLLSMLEASSERVNCIRILDLGSTEPITLRILDELERNAGSALEITRGGAAAELADLVNACATESTADYFLLVEPGHDIAPGFIDDACLALDRHPGFTHVTGHTSLDKGKELREAASNGAPFEVVKVVVGEALCSGLYANRFAGPAFLVRRSALVETTMASGLAAGMAWKHLRQSIANGGRVAVSSRIEVADMNSKNLFEGASPHADPSRFHHDMVRDEHFRVGRRALPMFALSKSVSINVQSGFGHGHVSLEGGSVDMEATIRRLSELENSRVVKYALRAAIAVSNRLPTAAVDALRATFRRRSAS